MTFGYILSDDLECVNEFQIDAEGHGVVVEVLVVIAEVLQGARILAVTSVDEAHVIAFVELGIATRAFLLHGLFKFVFVPILRQYTSKAHRLVHHFGLLLHHELQVDVVDSLLVHKENRILFL